MHPPVECTFTLTFDEFVAAHRRSVANAPVQVSIRPLLWLGVLAVVLFAASPVLDALFRLPTPDRSLPRLVLGFIVPVLAVIWWVVAFNKRYARWLVRSLWDHSPAMRGVQRFSIGADGITVDSEHVHAAYAWAGIEQLLQAGDTLVICPTPHTMLALPRGALPAGIDWDAFRHSILRWIVTARVPPAERGEDADELFPPLAFRVRHGDVMKVLRATQVGKQTWISWMVFIAVVIVYGIVDLVDPSSLLGRGMLSPAGITAILITLLVLGTLVRRWQADSVQRRTAWLREKVKLFVSTQGVTFETSSGRMTYKWLEIASLEMSRRCLLIRPRDQTLRIIPRRAFLTRDDDYAFQRLVNARIQRPMRDPLGNGFPIQPIKAPPVVVVPPVVAEGG